MKIILIGGQRDGDTINVPSKRPCIQVTADKMDGGEKKFIRESYELRELRASNWQDGESGTFYVYKIRGMTQIEMMKKLINGYNPE